MKKPLVLLAALSVVCPCAFAQTFQAAWSWDSRAGFQEKLIWAEPPWRVERVAGIAGFDLQPYFFGSFFGQTGGGGGVYAKIKAASNASVLIGPMLRLYPGERPTAGYMVGFSIELPRE